MALAICSIPLFGCYRHYWLASIHDGLYPGGDEYLVKNPAAAA